MGWKLAMRVYESALPAQLKSTAAALAMIYADDDTGENIYPSLERAAWLTSKSARQIRRDIGALYDRGVLSVLTPRTGGAGRTTHYRLNADALPTREAFPSKRGPTLPLHKNPDVGVRVDGECNPDTGVLVTPEIPDVGVRLLSLVEPENPDTGDTEPGHLEHERRTFETQKADVGVRRLGRDQEVDHPIVSTAPRLNQSVGPAAGLGSDKAREPNGDNLSHIKLHAVELMKERRLFGASQYSELVEATKQRCADLKVDYGRDPKVAHNVVHEACAWAQRQHLMANLRGKAATS